MNDSRLLLAIPFALLAACAPTGESTGIQTVSCPPDSTLTYDNFGADMIDTNCLECHEGKESPKLNTAAAIRSHSNQILSLAVYTDAMPEDADMPLAQREALGEWLACGAP